MQKRAIDLLFPTVCIETIVVSGNGESVEHIKALVCCLVKLLKSTKVLIFSC